ncbi:ABC transporter substrate-binding protein [Chelatococcus asaccharovorans]|uniref:ABC-type nitrate/sulfonate/bicarbonate transport system substrate-binding protein n=1 Tax=Chelatococcus asaccharovorans TaxID=28210 RepID=A0A2V3TWU7_9HYPH|nr:ABC transporter substrate-binding protein [Chelatococcus asaccharovorans]MBS7706728.1 ABC transporter substrate-binding protein [Chelatococcus asaccharovorans]PXW54128.1 ABC-type nitrate/sulfonate/bicarbonate transport system substrate-binding protein [Chelatococcus asaccharovorans]
MSKLDRRTFVKATMACAAAGLLPMSAEAQSLQKIRYLTPFGFIFGFSEALYGRTGGFFAKEGLDVEIEGGRGSAMAVQQVTAGNTLISRTGGTDLIKAYAKDPSIIAVGECYQKDIFHVISLADKPIKRPEDMAGKTIGIVSTGGATENLLDMMLVSKGVPVADVRREVVGNAPPAFEFIKLGRIDAFIATNDTLFSLQSDKQPVASFSVDEFAPSPGQVYMVSKRALDAQAETIAKFMRGCYAAIGDMIAKRADLAPVIASMTSEFDIVEAKRPDKGVTVLANAVTQTFEPVYRDKFASKEGPWVSAVDLMVKAKIVPPLDPKSLYNDSARKLAFG